MKICLSSSTYIKGKIMITILITMQLLGASMTIDVERMYGAMSMGTCNELLPIILWNYQSSSGFCWRGDIKTPPPQKI
jgi:hypothetical protein|tara:strand:- start:316 stop:549 length:234 start_codon:yes stop_codon:yes gene_type:complete